MPMRSSEGRCATGEMIRRPLSSKPMKPRSKRWSMLGVRRSPFSPFEPLFVGCIAPRLAVTSDQVSRVLDAGDPAPRFDPADAILETGLDPCAREQSPADPFRASASSLAISPARACAPRAQDRQLQPASPRAQPARSARPPRRSAQAEPRQAASATPSDKLIAAVAVRLKRRIAGGQQGPQQVEVVFGADGMVRLSEVDLALASRHSPSSGLPARIQAAWGSPSNRTARCRRDECGCPRRRR